MYIKLVGFDDFVVFCMCCYYDDWYVGKWIVWCLDYVNYVCFVEDWYDLI